MMTTWIQSEDSSDDENENEVDNMCFMAFEDKDEVKSNLDENEDFMFEYDDCLKPSTSLMKRTPLLRKSFLSFKKNLMK